MAVEIIPATDEDFSRFYGGNQIMGRWVGKKAQRGRLVAAFGGALEIADGVWFGWIDMPAHLKRPTLYRHAFTVMNEVKAAGATELRAACDDKIPRARELLMRLGFSPTDEEINGQRVWHVRT